jgi:predicted transcriptional regulator
MKRGRFEPREVVAGMLTENEEKVLTAWSVPKSDGTSKTVKEIAAEAGLTCNTTLRHLATLEKWSRGNGEVTND